MVPFYKDRLRAFPPVIADILALRAVRAAVRDAHPELVIFRIGDWALHRLK